MMNMMDKTETGPSPQNNPIWKKTWTIQMTSFCHEQLAIPTWKMPANKNEISEHSWPIPWQEKTRGHAQSTRSTNANKNNPGNTTTPIPST